LAAVAALAIGQLAIVLRLWPLYWLAFVPAAALPPLTALALAAQRIGPGHSRFEHGGLADGVVGSSGGGGGVGTTWRRALGGLLTGSLLSTTLAVLLSGLVALLAYVLIMPLRELTAALLASPSLERLFYSPALALGLIQFAVVAPLVEELTKPLAAIWLARRLRGPGEAFLIGMAGGVGFAIVENMLYEGAGERLWAGIVLLRGLGGALHPLNAGLVAMGWYAARNGEPGGIRRLLGYYGLAVGLHAFWNGGLTVLLSGIGAYFFGATTWRLDVFGVGQPGAVVVFLVVESIVLWRLLLTTCERLRDPSAPTEAGPVPRLGSPRRLALWATASLFAVLPLSALYGPLLARYVERLTPLR
jgi:RsiW-degrading membrane proteinase PrsW (M82 family)